MTHNTPQMALSSRVHQLKLINIPPHTEDKPPAWRAAGLVLAGPNDRSGSGGGSQSSGQQVHLAGRGGGHRVALCCCSHMMQAEQSCFHIDSRRDLVVDQAEHTAFRAWRSPSGVGWVLFALGRKSGSS